jgi:hypothetical protein
MSMVRFAGIEISKNHSELLETIYPVCTDISRATFHRGRCPATPPRRASSTARPSAQHDGARPLHAGRRPRFLELERGQPGVNRSGVPFIPLEDEILED